MARDQWLRFLVFQANMLYRLTVRKFLADLSKVLRYSPDLLCLNEVSSRRDLIARVGALRGYFVHQPSGPGQYDGVALLLKRSRYQVLLSGVKQMHKEPPGKPSARYCTWVIAWDLLAHRFVIFMGTHTLAAVERGNKLNRIARTRYYVQHILGLITLARHLRRLCKKQYGRSGQVILAGDMNWNWTPRAWIKRMLCGYYVSSHLACRGRVKTLGRRAVDVILKHGSKCRFVRHFVIALYSDHNGYGVVMSISKWRGRAPAWLH